MEWFHQMLQFNLLIWHISFGLCCSPFSSCPFLLFISNFIVVIYGIKSYDHHFKSHIVSFQYQSRPSPRTYLNAEGIQLFITCLLPQANPAKLKNCELSHMVFIKHGDLKFISSLQNKSPCQSTACAKFSIRKKLSVGSLVSHSLDSAFLRLKESLYKEL